MLLFCIYLLLSTILFLTRGGIILGLFCFYFTDVFFFKSVVLLFTIDSELWHLISKVSFIQYVRRIFRKTNISYPLIRRRTCAYQGVRNVCFFGKFGVLCFLETTVLRFALLLMINEFKDSTTTSRKKLFEQNIWTNMGHNSLLYEQAPPC